MSKKSVYRRNNTENIPVADRATIVPNQAPVVAKSTKLSAWGKVGIVALIVVAVLAIALFVVNVIIDSVASKINTTEPWQTQNVYLNQTIKNDGVYTNEDLLKSEAFINASEKVLANYAEASHSIKSSENVYNFAIYGANTFGSATEDTTAALVMIASFDTEAKKVTYITFEENILVYIPHKAAIGELRDAYEWGKAVLLTKTLQHNFGIAINGYIDINMAVATQLIDEVGGITVDANDAAKLNAAIKTYNELFDKEVADIAVSGGKANLVGEQALAYARMGTAEMSNLVKTLGSAIFQSGLGGMSDAFDIITENATAAITEEDYSALVDMASSMLSNATAEVINVGSSKQVIWHYAFAVYACPDYVGERVALQNKLYK